MALDWLQTEHLTNGEQPSVTDADSFATWWPGDNNISHAVKVKKPVVFSSQYDVQYFNKHQNRHQHQDYQFPRIRYVTARPVFTGVTSDSLACLCVLAI